MQVDEQAHTEAQELLSQWMEEKVNLLGGLDPDIDCNFEDDAWEKHEIKSDVKKEWDNLLANNYEEYGLHFLTGDDSKYKDSSDLYNLDEDTAVATVMKSMLDKQVVKQGFKKDLGLDRWGQVKDPRNKMELRHKQVKENREKREAELRRQREERQNRKIVQSAAQQLVRQEERQKELDTRREEMEIRKEMAKIRKDMQEERKKNEEKRARERESRQETELAARVKVAHDLEAEDGQSIESQRLYEERQRLLAQRVQQLETRVAANNLKIQHRFFSAWYNLVLDKRLKMGKARAMYDWKLLLRVWNAWRGYVRSRRLELETRRHEMEVISTQRNQQIAEKHSKLSLLRKYFLAWQVYVTSEQERRRLEQEQNSTRNKMAALLEAAASGKLGLESPAPTQRDQHSSRKERKTTAEKINAMFENKRQLPLNGLSDSLSTNRSEAPSNGPQPPGPSPNQSRIPTEPWQVTRRHLDLTTEEMAQIAGGEPTCSPEEMNAKVLKKYGRQPWHAREVSTYEHRHAAQKKILEEQKRQILEQQRLIEELQFKSTHAELQKQLTEQKLVLEQMKQQVEQGEQLQAEEEKGRQINEEYIKNGVHEDKPSSKTPKSTSKQQRPHSANTKTPSKAPPRGISATSRPQSAGSSRGQRSNGAETSRTEAQTVVNGAMSARTDVSRPSTFTSTASEKSKYLQVLKNMEDRSAERARQKKEREERRKLQEEQKLTELEAQAEAQKQQDEAEKKARAEAYRERKRLEKQREIERQTAEEKLRQQVTMADQHYQRAILKYRGILPMRKLVQMAKENEKRADEHFENVLQRKVLLAWHAAVKEEWREKEALADQMSNFLCVKHAFQSWRLYKRHQIIEEHKAKKHYEVNIVSKLFQAWRDYANEEKVASWEKERKAREHYRKLLLKRHFIAWRQLPQEIEREKEREKRREELRQKVAAMLPDFEPTISVSESLVIS
ncbi:coiled-coil domain-containing protein 191-like isoform X2 [Dreissena polymorpha]|nr:coiled-coil domain-containing protein 191-like isoform X2 [Dreissena polymorpha]